MLGFIFLFSATHLLAQKTEEITKKNSWLKLGVSASVPVGDISNYSSFAAGLEISGQLMETKHFGLGLTSGYTNFFPKNNGESFGVIPLGVMLRYYPEYEGFFAGTDIGYSFLTNFGNTNGGFYLKPQAGYHNYDWNIYAFYNQVFTSNAIDVQNVGVAATYNIHFK